MNHYGHSGDMGDIIFSLPCIRASGGGVLHLFNTPGKTTQALSRDRFDFIAPLIRAQTYIHEVVYDGDDRTHDSSINGFRHHGGTGRNLSDMHLATHGLGWEHRQEKWLTVEPAENAPLVVFARSSRYHNDKFPWNRIADKYREVACFVGLDDEYADFQKQFGKVDRFVIRDATGLAKLIAASGLLVTNQTLAGAIGEGLKANIISETYLENPNCRVNRIGRLDAMDDRIELPEIYKPAEPEIPIERDIQVPQVPPAAEPLPEVSARDDTGHRRWR